MTMQRAFIVKNSFLEEVDESDDAPKPMIRSFSDSALCMFVGLDSESDDEEDDCMDKRSEATASTTDSVKRWSDEDDLDDMCSASGCSPRHGPSPSPAGPPPGVHFVNQPPPGVHQGPPGVNQPPGVHCVPVETVFWVAATPEAETTAKPQFLAGPPGCWNGGAQAQTEESE
jgi:hypothetical protein